MAEKLIEYLTIHNQIRDMSRINCKEIGDTHLICGVIAISKNHKILLVRGRRTGKWSLPKGHVEKQESPMQCATRELSEETGIVVTDFTRKNDIAKLRIGIYYFFEPEWELTLKPSDSSEVMEAGWFSLTDLRTKNMELNADANYIYRCLQKCWVF